MSKFWKWFNERKGTTIDERPMCAPGDWRDEPLWWSTDEWVALLRARVEALDLYDFEKALWGQDNPLPSEPINTVFLQHVPFSGIPGLGRPVYLQDEPDKKIVNGKNLIARTYNLTKDTSWQPYQVEEFRAQSNEWIDWGKKLGTIRMLFHGGY